MRSPRNVHRPYTVEIVAEAWEQVSYLPRDTYRAIQARLESVGQQAALKAPEATQEEAPSFRHEDLTIHYVVDARRRLIKLLRISRERAHSATQAYRAESQG
ncbi:hypothetical protein JY651_15985 [Pyxidicoccus parkwayensis]|uniref:Type II toxin-antitoxin system RelE/ParE family toxin n=1 Tax=Pyxidicoccus parkwayensis TaxID=2813578 RepID=A0ABX7P7A3_9BACT|nr:hypothetical protein [Pyxidicoccus parkwaysis]QSQ26336.1 hypothetical protein JY651_15985 [Pyxidicoccus parkwaysis]